MPVASSKIYRNTSNQGVKTHAELKEKGFSDADIADALKDGIIVEEKKKALNSPSASNGKETPAAKEPASSSTGEPVNTEQTPAPNPAPAQTADKVPAQQPLAPPLADPLTNTDYTPGVFKNPSPGGNVPPTDPNAAKKTPGSYDFLKEYYEKQTSPLFHSDNIAQDQHDLVDRVTKQQVNTQIQKQAEPKRKAVADQIVDDILGKGGKSKFMSAKRPILDTKPFAPDIYYGKLNMSAVDSLLDNTQQVTVDEAGKKVTYALDDRDKQEIRNRVQNWFPQAKDAYDLYETTKRHYEGLKDDFGHNTDPTVVQGKIATTVGEEGQAKVKEATAAVSKKTTELQERVTKGELSAADANAELTRYSTSLSGDLDAYVKHRTQDLQRMMLPNLYKDKIEELTKVRDGAAPNTVTHANAQKEIDDIQKKIDAGETYKLEDDPKWQAATQSAYKALMISKNEQSKAVVDDMWRTGPNKQTTFNDMKNFAAKQVQGLFQGIGSTESIIGGIFNMHGNYGIGNYWTDSGKAFAEVNQLPAPIDKNGNPQIFDDSIGTWVAKNVTAQIPLMVPLIATAEAGGATLGPLVESLGLLNKATPFVRGAVGGLASSVPEALFEAGDMYNQSIEEGRSTRDAESNATNVFKKNMYLLGFSNPLEFGLMKIPGHSIAQKIFKAGLEANINGAQEIVQNYFQEHETKPGLRILDYAVSPEGINTYLSGAGVGILQNAVVGSLEHWQAGNATNKMFNYMNQHGGVEGSNLPSNYVIAKVMYNALAAHDSPNRVKQLHGIVDQYEQAGSYTPEEAARVKSVIDDVNAVKGKVPQIVDPLRQTAILNELLKQKTITDAIKASGSEQTAVSSLKDDLKASDDRIKNIFTGDEPLYFVHGYETNKEQLTEFINGDKFNKNIQVDIFNDKEATDLYNSKVGKKQQKPAADTKNANDIPAPVENTTGEPADEDPLPTIHGKKNDLLELNKNSSMLLHNNDKIAREFGKLNAYDLRNKIHDEGYTIDRDNMDDKVEPDISVIDKEGNHITLYGSKNLLNQVRYKVAMVRDKNGDSIFSSTHKDDISESIKDGDYDTWIEDGRMTANDAKKVIENVGLKVPKSIQDKATAELSQPSLKLNGYKGEREGKFLKNVNGVDIHSINNGAAYTLYSPTAKGEYSRTGDLGHAEDIASQYKPKPDANQKQGATEIPVRQETSGSQKNGEGDKELQPSTGEGQAQKGKGKKEEVKPKDTGITGFKTSKGSSYQIMEDGSTIRDKAARPEHPGEKGIQPKSEQTYYLTKEQLDKMDLLQATPPEGKFVVAKLDNGDIAVGTVGGKNNDTHVAKTRITPSEVPKVGLYPLEVSDNGRSHHFGNEITEVIGDNSNANTSIDNKTPKQNKTQQDEGVQKQGAAEVPVREQSGIGSGTSGENKLQQDSEKGKEEEKPAKEAKDLVDYKTDPSENTPFDAQERFLPKKVKEWKNNFDDKWEYINKRIDDISKEIDKAVSSLKGKSKEEKEKINKTIYDLTKDRDNQERLKNRTMSEFENQMRSIFQSRADKLGIKLSKEDVDNGFANFMDQITERPGIEFNWDRPLVDVLDEAINEYKPKTKKDEKANSTIKKNGKPDNAGKTSANVSDNEKAGNKKENGNERPNVLQRDKDQEITNKRKIDNNRETFKRENNIDISQFGLRPVTDEEIINSAPHHAGKLIAGEDKRLTPDDVGKYFVDSYSGKVYKVDRYDDKPKSGKVFMHDVVSGKQSLESTESGMGRQIYQEVDYKETPKEDEIKPASPEPEPKPAEQTNTVAEADPLLHDAATLIFNEGIASVALLQRRLKLGYNRAERIIDQLKHANLIGEDNKDIKVKSQQQIDDYFRAQQSDSFDDEVDTEISWDSAKEIDLPPVLERRGLGWQEVSSIGFTSKEIKSLFNGEEDKPYVTLRSWSTGDGNVVKYGDKYYKLKTTEAAAEENSSEATPVKMLSEKEILAQELADKKEALRKALLKSRGQLNVGIDPGVLTAGIDILGTYAKMGIFKFKEFVRDLVDSFGREVMDDENIEAMKGVYAAFKQNNKELRPMMDKEEVLDDFSYSDLEADDNKEPTTVEEAISEIKKIGDGTIDITEPGTDQEATDRESDVAALEAKGETAIAKAKSVKGRKQSGKTIEGIDGLVSDINDQLGLLGYYDTTGSTEKDETERGNKAPERKFKQDLTKFSKALAAQLGWEHETDKKGKAVYADTNVPPAGGDGHIMLFKPGSKYGVYISVPVQKEYSSRKGYHDELTIAGVLQNAGYGPIMWRINDRDNKYSGGSNQWISLKDFNVGNMAAKIEKEINALPEKPYLPNQSKISENGNTSIQNPLRPNQGEVDGGEPAAGTSTTVRDKQTEGVSGGSSGTSIPKGGPTDRSSENTGRSTGTGDIRNDSAGSNGTVGSDNEKVSTTEPDGSPTLEGNTGEPLKEEKVLTPSERNMVIPESMNVVPEGGVPKLTANMNAILLLHQLEEQDRNATPEEKNELVKFVGWGGLASYLDGDPDDKFTKAIISGEPVKLGYGREFDPGKELSVAGRRFEDVVEGFRKAYQKAISDPDIKRWAHDEAAYGKGVTLDFARKQVIAGLLPSDVFESAKVSTINAHYTEGGVIRSMWNLAKQLGFKGGTVLESSMGIGHFFGMMPQEIAQKSEMVGVELDKLSGRIAQKLYPQNNILIKGFEDVHFPPNSIDFAIGNVPFAEKGLVEDTKNKDINGFSLHNYFIAKNLKLLKPGGIAILITSKATMDNASSAKARRWFGSIEGGNSDLIGAVRLPNNAFDKNAGTQVTTDIMVFKKRTGDISDTQPFFSTENIRTEMIENEKADIDINEYYVAHPENMIGEMKFAFEVGSGGLYSKLDPTLHAPEGTNVMQRLKDAFSTFPKDIYKQTAKVDDGKGTDIFSSEKAGKILMQDGKVYQSEGEIASPVEFRYKTHEQAAKSYIPLRESVYPLLEAELNPEATDEEIEAHRKNLNIIYDDFVKKHGAISGHANWLFDLDIDFPLVAALENVKNVSTADKSGKIKRSKEVTKGDMLLKRVNFPRTIPSKADTHEDAIKISMAYKGHIDNDYVGALMGLKEDPENPSSRADDAKATLLAKGLVYENPGTGLLEIPDYYLSGKVRTKLTQAKAAAESNYAYQRNVDALEKVQPENIPAGSIEFKIGVSYLPIEMYKKFAEETLGVEGHFRYIESIGQWEINLVGSPNDARNTQTYAVSGVTGFDMMKDAMSNRTTTIWKDGPTKGSKVVDEAATGSASDMQYKINQDFIRFVKRNEDYRNTLEDLFNENFNNWVEPKISLPPFDHYPGAVHSMNGKPFKLRNHQMKAVIRAINQNTLLAHDVGTGKTFTIITTAMEMRRLGIAKKPMIVVKNSTLEDFAQSFKKLYPTARILVLSKDEINAKNRKLFFGRIPTGEWDAVIVPQSQFDMMPDKPERILNYMQEKLAEMRAIMESTDDQFLKKRLEKEMDDMIDQMSSMMLTKEDKAAAEVAGELAGKNAGTKSAQSKAKKEGKRIAKITASVRRMTDRKTDNIIDFDGMGVDALIIDESHSYKRLGFQTNIQKVKGIDVAASKKAVSAYLKTQAVMERSGGKNVVFATGTPITNTMAELWTNMRYLIPDTVREMGINTFDQFQQAFTEITDSVEQNAGGNFEAVQRLSTFYNLPELVKTFRSFADIVSTDDIPEFKADPDNAPPQLKGGKVSTVILPMTKTLKSVMLHIRDSYQEYKSMTGAQKRENSYRPLLLYYIGKVAPIDPRIINPFLDDDPGSKANEAVKNALRLYHEYDKYKGTQMIFSDSIASSDAEKIREILHIPQGGPTFNLYNDIRDKLIKGGVPAHEIAILTDKKYDKDEAKKKLFDMVNEGTVRILIGSTEKMGVGVNAQERMIALHHVDAPARPDLFTQRNGRILRQGNMFAKLGIPVEIFAYGMEGTRDATAFQRLEKKQSFITQMFKGNVTDRRTEDAAAEEEGNIDDFFAELGASLSGNKDAMKLVLVKKDLKREENRQYSFEQRMQDAGNSLRRQQRALPDINARIIASDNALVNLEKSFPDRKIKSLTLNGVVVTEKLAEELESKVIKPLLEKSEDIRGKAGKEIERSTIIKINDVEATVIVKAMTKTNSSKDFTAELFLRSHDLNIGTPEDEKENVWGKGRKMETNGGIGMLQIVRNEFTKIEDNPERWRTLKQKTETNISQLESDLQGKYDSTKLNQLRAEKKELERSILASGDMSRYKVEKVDDETFFVKDSIGGLEHVDENKETKFFKTELEAKTVADQLNRQFAAKADVTRYVVGKGDTPGTYNVLDREEANKVVGYGTDSIDLATLDANLRNDEKFGELSDRTFYPATFFGRSRYGETTIQITIGKQFPVTVDEDNRVGYEWRADKAFIGRKEYTFDNLNDAMAVADRMDRDANPEKYAPKKTLDEQIKDARKDLRDEIGGQLSMAGPINAIPQLTKLAWLYIQKGVKTAGQFASEMGTRLTKEVKSAWDAATGHWRSYKKTGVVPAGMPTPTPTTPPASSATSSPLSTMSMNAKKRSDAAREAQDKWKEVERKLFGSETINDDFYKKRKKNPLSMALNMPNTIQDATFGTITDTFGHGLKRLTEKGLQNKNKVIRTIAKSLNQVFANMGKSTQDILAGEKFAGEAKVRSINDAVKIGDQLRSLVDNDPSSLNKVQRLLDPEFFKELSQDEFEEAMQVDMDEIQFAKMKQSVKDEMYKEYRKRMGFDEPDYKRDITISDLTPAEQKLYELTRLLYDTMHEMNFAMGKLTIDTYDKNKGNYSARLYDFYEIPKEAEAAIRGSSSKLDESLYREKGEITAWKLLHRLDDPVYAVTKRLYQTLANKAIIDYSEYIVKNKPDATSSGERAGYRRLGFGYGALSGKYVRDDIAEDFIGHFYANDLMQKFYDMVKQYDKIPVRQFYKKLFTVYNPGVHVGNVMGNVAFAAIVGINPVRLMSNIPWAKKQASEYGPEYRYLLSSGLLNSDITREDLVRAMDRLDIGTEEASKSKNPIAYVKDKMQKIYGATDDLFKMAAFKSLVEQGYSAQDAMNRVKQGFQNYMRVGKSYDLFSKIPIIGQPFGKFGGDLLRIVTNGISTHPLTTYAFLMFIKAMARLASNLSGEDDKERRIREARAGFPHIPVPDFLGGDIPLAFKVGDNELNVARILSPLYLYSTTSGDEAFAFWSKLSPQPIDVPEWTKNPGGMVAATIAQNANDPVVAPVVQLIVNSDFRGVPIIDPKETKFAASTLTNKEKIGNSLRFLARSYTPFGATGDDFVRALMEKKDYYGRDRSPWQVIASFFGGVKFIQFPDERYQKIVTQKMDSYGYQFEQEARAVSELTKEVNTGEIDWETYEDRVAPHLQNEAEISQRARDEYKKLTEAEGGLNRPNTRRTAVDNNDNGAPSIDLPDVAAPTVDMPEVSVPGN